jgi:polyisoprenoid-binding protein YceI
MRTFSLIASFLFIASIAVAQNYTPVDADSKVHFVIKNFGFKTGGDFTGLKGSIVFNPNTLGNSKFNVTVDAATIDTDNNMRDNHLRKTEYFAVEKYPQIRFESTKITNSTIAGRFYVFGNLTIKGVTKAVEFGFNATPLAKGYLLNGELTINRKDFGVGGNSVSLSDNVIVYLTITATE